MAKKATTKDAAIVNPFDKGVSYTEFLKACGSKSPKTYLKGLCYDSQIEWLESELEHYKNNKKKK